MSARDDIRRYVSLLGDMWTPREQTDARVEMLYRAVRAEVLAEAADFVGNDDDCDCGGCTTCVPRKLAEGLREMAEGKRPRPAADAVPGLTDRQARLLDAIRTHGGDWTTARVRHLYALIAPEVVQRGTARRDLAALHRAGHLVLADDPDHRHYVLRRKDGRS